MPRAAIASASDSDKTAVTGLGFPRACRLLKPADYNAVFARRQAIRGRFFSCHLRVRESGSARLGLVIPKKLLRRAVRRNQVKRLIRETFRLMRAGLPIADFVFRLTSRPPADSRRSAGEAIRGDILALCEKSRRLSRATAPGA